MEFNETDITIEKYIQGELSGEPLKEFELQIENDKDLQKKVNLYQYTDAVLFDNLSRNKNAGEVNAKFKANLEELGHTYFPKETANEFKPTTKVAQEEAVTKSPIIKRLLPFVTLAAAAALLLFFIFPKEKNTLYAKNFEPEKLITTQSSADNSSIFSQANKHYRTENYKEAIPLYAQDISENPGNPWALVYKGCSHMAVNQIDEAMILFEQLAKQYSDFSDMAYWYLALCHLKKEEETQAKTILKRISPEEKVYFDKAQKLLKAF